MKNGHFTDKTTRHFRNVIAEAFNQAAKQGTKVVTPLHLLYATISEKGSIGEEILQRAGVKKEIVTQLLTESEIIPVQKNSILSPVAKRIIEKAVTKAASENHTYIGTEHLVFGLLEVDAADIEFVIMDSNIVRKDLENQLNVALKSAGKLQELLAQIWETPETKQIWKSTNEKTGKQKTPALEYFATELTNPMYVQKLDPVIGRDTEIERVIHVLARRTKNNPLLLGEPGVGKTAIVEGLAKRIVAGEVPPTLLDKKIFSVDLGLMIAGTMYRGEFESRIKQMIDEVKSHPEIILFIDEIHSIVGAGSSNGTLDAANLLKPALARGELRVIGATTFDEFKKHIEHDAALERRFQSVQVKEPTAEETELMLEHIKGHYERFHGVSVAPDALSAAVTLAHTYFPEKRFPDKAIDLLDEAMSAVKIKHADAKSIEERAQLKEALATLENKKQKAILKENFEDAQRIKLLEQDLILKLTAFEDREKTAAPRGVVTIKEIQSVVERVLRRPIKEARDSSNKTSLFDEISSQIFGQDESVTAISQTITRAQLGLGDNKRPLASFLFVGPSGVGKTELAKQIARNVFGDETALIKLDMTEFTEGYSVSKMMGAPAGYVGYKENTTLADRIRRQPMSVILFDEADKAHPDVLNSLLHMLEEGTFKDASGKEASVRQSIIILTYQVAPEELQGSSFGFTKSTEVRSADSVKSSLYSSLKPELLNRIDAVCVLRSLDVPALTKIAQKTLTDFAERLAKKTIDLIWDESIPEKIAQKAYNAKEGARKIRLVIDADVQQPIVTHLSKETQPISYQIGIKSDILTVEPRYGTTQSVPNKPTKPQLATNSPRSRSSRRGK